MVLSEQLWFDVEEKGNTTGNRAQIRECQLWFDVEEKGNTTQENQYQHYAELWFDVEEKGNTTFPCDTPLFGRCGLM